MLARILSRLVAHILSGTLGELEQRTASDCFNRWTNMNGSKMNSLLSYWLEQSHYISCDTENKYENQGICGRKDVDGDNPCTSHDSHVIKNVFSKEYFADLSA
jgi:hypothetical protein